MVSISNENGYGGVEDWRGHYNTVKGPEKIEARQRVYWLAHELDASPDNGRTDLELESIEALQRMGIDRSEPVVDIGCSFPNYLQLWKLHGHTGRLIGIEPNAEQFNGLSYWRPSANQISAALGSAPLFDTALFEDIELIEAWADQLPLPAGIAAAASMMLMMYHVPKDLQRDALQEAKRIIDAEKGVFVLTTRGKDNKAALHEGEIAIGQALTAICGHQVAPPPPVNRGFTAEDARLVLPELYSHVYELKHSAEIRITDRAGVSILERAIWSLLDKYRDTAGNPPSENKFEMALKEVYGRQFAEVYAGKLVIRDMLHESLFIAADRELALEPRFQCI